MLILRTFVHFVSFVRYQFQRLPFWETLTPSVHRSSLRPYFVLTPKSSPLRFALVGHSSTLRSFVQSQLIQSATHPAAAYLFGSLRSLCRRRCGFFLVPRKNPHLLRSRFSCHPPEAQSLSSFARSRGLANSHQLAPPRTQ